MQVNIFGKSLFGTIRYSLECIACGHDITLDRKVLLGNIKVINCYKCRQRFNILRMDFDQGNFNIEYDDEDDKKEEK